MMKSKSELYNEMLNSCESLKIRRKKCRLYIAISREKEKESETISRLRFDIHCQYWKSIVYVTYTCRFLILTMNIETQPKTKDKKKKKPFEYFSIKQEKKRKRTCFGS